MSSNLMNDSILKHGDLVGVFDSGQSVGDGDAGPASSGLVQSLLDNLRF